jgi:hypothetical protein
MKTLCGAVNLLVMLHVLMVDKGSCPFKPFEQHNNKQVCKDENIPSHHAAVCASFFRDYFSWPKAWQPFFP